MAEQGSNERVITLHQTHNEKGKLLFVTNKISTTKYNPFTFIFKFLFEQFTRIANFYFLVVVVLLSFKWAPISAAVAVLPLCIVLGISMIREIIEDILRWRSDRRVNSTIGHRLENGEFKDTPWENIACGDFVVIKKDEQIPADIVIFSSSDEKGLAFVDTCNLDGETNLKVKQAIQSTVSITTPQAASEYNCRVTCELPNNKLEQFNGYLETESREPLENKQLLLRGSVLRNTEFAAGIVVYTGKESKIMKNANKPRTKRSHLEKGLNSKIISVFAFLIIASIISASAGQYYETHHVNNGEAWYFYRNQNNRRHPVSAWWILWVSQLVVINATVPISLYVTLEIVRVFQAFFVSWDADMYDIPSNTAASVHTTTISDDLGQISYVFSDKTGTLTQNCMEFMKCSVAGVIYGTGTTEVAYAAAKRQGIKIPPPDKTGNAFKDDQFFSLLNSEKPPPEILHFVYLLSLCHAVIPEVDETKPHGISFQAPSPDEAALVSAAADMGYVFTHRDPTELTLQVHGVEKKFPILANLEFTSARKRSSVIIRNPDTNQIVLYCKGADDLIMSRLSSESPFVQETQANLKEFSANGLRTLCCAYRVLDEEFFNGWSQRFQEANCAIVGREEAVDTVANEVESDLMLIGSTAIEDKLQEGVPATIAALLKANINVWVITGDKRETAINIGYACSLLSNDMKMIILDNPDEEQLMEQTRNAIQSAEGKLALVASGASLHTLLSDENKETFYQLSQKCQSVICCRVSPLQKATIVKIMREKTKKLALAIGDGANDVGMIMEADIGCGISGKEGRQAVLASDYSFAQFRYLKRLLLVHGRLNFYRNVELINYSFYKNMAFSINNFIYSFFDAFGGTTMYDPILYTVFNVIYTSVPPVVYAAMDRDVSLKSMMDVPELYDMDGKKDYFQSYLRFWFNLLLGMFHGIMSFFVTYFSVGNVMYHMGYPVSREDFGIIIYQAIVIIVNLRMAIMSSYWTWIAHLFIWLSITIYPASVAVIDAMGISPIMKGMSTPLMRTSAYWFISFTASIIGMIPVVIQRAIVLSRDTLTNRIIFFEHHNMKLPKTDDDDDLENL